MLDAFLNPLISFDCQNLLPLSDAAMRLLQFPDKGLPLYETRDSRGLYCMLRALAITGVRVENLITERASSPNKGGIELVNTLRPQKPGFELAKASSYGIRPPHMLASSTSARAFGGISDVL
jgi:hypothetical protein